jgi:hypothetical protein
VYAHRKRRALLLGCGLAWVWLNRGAFHTSHTTRKDNQVATDGLICASGLISLLLIFTNSTPSVSACQTMRQTNYSTNLGILYRQAPPTGMDREQHTIMKILLTRYTASEKEPIYTLDSKLL